MAERSNEIVAIPPLLGMMAIEGAIVTIDAMRGQRDIAQRILKKRRLRAHTQRQSRHTVRRCRSLLCRAKRVSHRDRSQPVQRSSQSNAISLLGTVGPVRRCSIIAGSGLMIHASTCHGLQAIKWAWTPFGSGEFSFVG
jgi:hypothetical protein